jgi:hypothetical protein
VFQLHIITISIRNKVAFGGLPDASESGLHRRHGFERRLNLQPTGREVATVLKVPDAELKSEC